MEAEQKTHTLLINISVLQLLLLCKIVLSWCGPGLGPQFMVWQISSLYLVPCTQLMVPHARGEYGVNHTDLEGLGETMVVR